MEKIIFPQFSKRWKIPKKISFELSNHPSSCTGSPSANTQRTTNASQRDLSIRVGEVANLHAFGGFRLLEMDGKLGGWVATPTNFSRMQPQPHFNFHEKKSGQPELFFGADSFFVRIHLFF